MRNPTRSWLFCVLLLSLPLDGVGADSSSGAAARLESAIKQIETEPSPHVRANLARRLHVLVQEVDPSDFSPTLIDEIANLLRGDEEYVQIAAAASLQHIGSSASRAIPALERALEETAASYGILPPEGASTTIAWALIEIRNTAPEPEQSGQNPL